MTFLIVMEISQTGAYVDSRGHLAILTSGFKPSERKEKKNFLLLDKTLDS